MEYALYSSSSCIVQLHPAVLQGEFSHFYFQNVLIHKNYNPQNLCIWYIMPVCIICFQLQCVLYKWLYVHISILVLNGDTFHTNLIIIKVTHISMFRNYSFNFGWNVTKRGRNMERRRERNIAEPKFELKSFRPSSCVFYGRGRI